MIKMKLFHAKLVGKYDIFNLDRNDKISYLNVPAKIFLTPEFLIITLEDKNVIGIPFSSILHTCVNEKITGKIIKNFNIKKPENLETYNVNQLEIFIYTLLPTIKDRNNDLYNFRMQDIYIITGFESVNVIFQFIHFLKWLTWLSPSRLPENIINIRDEKIILKEVEKFGKFIIAEESFNNILNSILVTDMKNKNEIRSFGTSDFDITDPPDNKIKLDHNNLSDSKEKISNRKIMPLTNFGKSIFYDNENFIFLINNKIHKNLKKIRRNETLDIFKYTYFVKRPYFDKFGNEIKFEEIEKEKNYPNEYLKYAIIVNPTSGSNSDREKIIKKLKMILNFCYKDYDIFFSEYHGHTKTIIENIVRNNEINEIKYDIIVSVGGDGTLFEIVNKLDSMQQLKNIPIGIVSAGGGNGVMTSLLTDMGYEVDVDNNLYFLIKGKATNIKLADVKVALTHIPEIKEHKKNKIYKFEKENESNLQNQEKVYEVNYKSCLSFAWGTFANVDVKSEKYKYFGTNRFYISALEELFTMKLEKCIIEYNDAAYEERKNILNSSLIKFKEEIEKSNNNYYTILLFVQKYITKQNFLCNKKISDISDIGVITVDGLLSKLDYLNVLLNPCMEDVLTKKRYNNSKTSLSYASNIVVSALNGYILIDGEYIGSGPYVIQYKNMSNFARIYL